MISDTKLFLSARINRERKILDCTIESSICLFVYAYCDFEIKIYFVDDTDYKCCVPLEILEGIDYEFISADENQYKELFLVLPAIETDNKKTYLAGICAVLRWAIKYNLEKFPDSHAQSLLGFRGGCLVACTESSVWTKFCELQLPNSVTEMKSIKENSEKSVTIPDSLVLLEAHFKRPVRTHNILKRKLDIAKMIKQKNSLAETMGSTVPTEKIEFTIYDKNLDAVKSEDVSKTLENLVITEKSDDFNLHHNYLEGIDLTLADMIAFPCVHYLLKTLPLECMKYLAYVRQWYERMISNTVVKRAADKCGFSMGMVQSVGTLDITVPVIDKDSLYKRDPSHTKLKVKHKSPQEILSLLQNASIHPQYSTNFCSTLKWEQLPSDLHPATGDLPQKRIDRKCQQIESMVTAVLKVAKDGQTIVEFCAGGGHVGLLLAYFLPNCKVVLIENKESSIDRARKRAKSLNLMNVFFYQCNLDYFKGSFDLGVSLHACGVATDLVIQQCIQQRASFVCCPCCYGGVQNTHLLNYPLSKKFCSTSLPYEKYLLLAHCADRTEINTPTAEQDLLPNETKKESKSRSTPFNPQVLLRSFYLPFSSISRPISLHNLDLKVCRYQPNADSQRLYKNFSVESQFGNWIHEVISGLNFLSKLNTKNLNIRSDMVQISPRSLSTIFGDNIFLKSILWRASHGLELPAFNCGHSISRRIADVQEYWRKFLRPMAREKNTGRSAPKIEPALQSRGIRSDQPSQDMKAKTPVDFLNGKTDEQPVLRPEDAVSTKEDGCPHGGTISEEKEQETDTKLEKKPSRKRAFKKWISRRFSRACGFLRNCITCFK